MRSSPEALRVDYDPRVRVPPDSIERLRPDHPRLLELRQRYAALGATDIRVAPDIQLPWFRGSEAYVSQHPEIGPEAYSRMLALADYVATRDSLGLLKRLKEDGLFGCRTFVHPRWGRVSRDLLDSVNEINFLERHQAFPARGLRVADAGAGYGRFAHRLCEALDSVQRCDCFDDVPESTFLCEYYLSFRGARQAHSVPLYDADRALRQGYDLARIFSPRAAGHRWVERLVAIRVPCLLIVGKPDAPHVSAPLLTAAGYSLDRREALIEDAAVREHLGAQDCFLLYRRAP